MNRILLLVSVFLVSISSAEEVGEKLVFKTEWKGERIALPPSFAPKMKMNGIEEIRFAPGMFKADAEDFFSYVFVFSLSGDQKLDEEFIKAETLTYYRGLGEAVAKGKGKEVDGSKFKFEMKKDKEAKQVVASVSDKKTVAQYTGKLDWIEPFATGKSQVLHFEIQAWTDPQTKRNYLFVGTSPKKISDEDEIWKQLRKIRSEFEVKAE